MKKLLSIVGLALLALFATPNKSQATGNCVLYWVPNIQYFQAGGTVRVVHANGTSYYITAADVVPGDQYAFFNGDDVFVNPGSCALWQ